MESRKVMKLFFEKMGIFCRNGRDYKRKTNCLIRNMFHSVYKQRAFKENIIDVPRKTRELICRGTF